MTASSPLTLVIMAAGMGSRYGGLKQAAAVGPKGEWLLEYSLQDAAQAGFTDAVLVIRPEMEATFRQHLSAARFKPLNIHFAPQTLSHALPTGFSLTTTAPARTKPWGTGHAVLCAQPFVQGAFAVLNADDYYGRHALSLLAHFLKNTQPNTLAGALLGYRLKNTLSPHGPVSRAVCETNTTGHLKSLTEHTKIIDTPSGLIDQAALTCTLNPEATVSLNAWAFTHAFFNTLTAGFSTFLNQLTLETAAGAEYYLPSAVTLAMQANNAPITIIPTEDAYAGLTYPEDLPGLRTLLKDH